jgi:hypothetical protein
MKFMYQKTNVQQKYLHTEENKKQTQNIEFSSRQPLFQKMMEQNNEHNEKKTTHILKLTRHI